MNTATLGNYCLALAMLGSGGAVLASICAARFKSSAALSNARWLIHVVTALLTIAGTALVLAILNNEFALEYVASHSNKALPWAYKLSALWAGSEGSLLLWAWMIAAVSSIAVILSRKDEAASHGPAVGILGAICGMFIALMLFTSNPFALGEVVPADGFDMNPLLQHWAMIAHPPTLFLGYAGFTVPFALAFGALIGGRSDNRWIAPVRGWVIASWLFLTIGIVLGAWWAYVELGWGGYWAWDAVENASLLPWLTGTALMHSLIVQQRRGTLKVWNIWLISVTFLLCIFGTYLTRSGIIQSVHTFQPSSVGPFILEMLRVGVAFSVGVIIWRGCLLRSERKIDKLVSYEGAFIAGNVLLVVIMLTTLVGTIFPILSKPFGEESVTLGKEFYNSVVVPMALLLAALMAAGPLLRYVNAPGVLTRRLIAPGIAAIAAVVVAGFWSVGYMDADFWAVSEKKESFRFAGTMWMMACAGVAAFTVACIAEDVIRTAGALRSAAIRRWGGQLVHLGMAMMVIGVAGSSIYKTEKTMALKAGEVQRIGKYNVRLEGVECIHKDNYHADEARIGVSAPGIEEVILRPQRRKYHSRPSKFFSEVDVHSTVLEDVYITQAEPTEDGKTVIEVVVSPLVLWIWIGGIAMSLGSLACLVTPGARRSKPATGPDVPPAPCPEAPRGAPMKALTVVMMLLLLDGSAPAVDPPDAATSMPGGMPPMVAMGSIAVKVVQGTKGGPKIGPDEVIVELYGHGGMIYTSKTELDVHGVAMIENLPLEAPFRPRVIVKHGGTSYSQDGEAMNVDNPTQDITVKVFETTDKDPRWEVAMWHFIVQPVEEGGLEVIETYSVQNMSDSAYLGPPDTDGRRISVALTLPPGAQKVKMGGQLHASHASVVDNRVLSRAPLVPEDMSKLLLNYVLPARGGKAEVTLVAPAAARQLLVLVPADNKTLKSDHLEIGDVFDVHNRPMRAYKLSDISAGQKISFTLGGLPGPVVKTSYIPHMLAALGGVILVILCIVIILIDRSEDQVEAEAA